MQVPASTRLRFEDFDLDAGCRTLCRAGQRLDLRPRSFDVLVYLAEAAGRPVGKDELLAAVWPDVVVGEESLTRCVSDIRQVLGENGQDIIKTLPRRGYVFAAPVEPAPASRVGDAGLATPAGEAAVPPPSTRTAMGQLEGETTAPLTRGAAAVALWRGLAVAAAAVVAAAALVGWWPQRDAPAAPPALPRLSIAVLPLASDGADPAQDRLATVLTDEITVDLTRIPESFVIARATAESYRGRNVDARQVGRELGVRYVLQGGLVRLGDTARLTLQLVDSESGRTLWADRIDGELPDVSALYRQVTGTVARSLDLTLQEVEAARARARPSADSQDLLLQARWLLQFNRTTPDSLQEARRLLEQVSARDPGSALAIALLAQTYNYDVSQRWLGLRGATREQWLQQADRLSAQAFQLDPADARVVGVRGTTLALAGRSEQAVELLERQIVLNRNDASAWFWLGYARCTLGRPDEAIAALEQARRLSPRDPNLNGIFIVTATAHLHLGHDREALEWAQRSVLERPQHAVAHSWVAAAAANLGETETARAALAEFRRRLPDYTISSFRNERLCANDLCRAQRERYYEGLAKAGLPE
ncbi:MAG: winged helix-turn-helix domain-containing protein [Hydrogenophaga sp.]|uniref:winged helix-turn-helix domain-containing tetratricopeptide repeat protein n=1 Tax=Hydrogenophaga sp. TaxID=1904254 RepID=UPI0025B91522|nr:winged helix-turn-helix domain-containing protein [Hydrogenophaga sp.]MBT9549412.1 winged helix-turn-helix domain-containing protein [Hydrogenophaga sp.]